MSNFTFSRLIRCLASLLALTISSPAIAQDSQFEGEGTLGWYDAVSASYYGSADAACEAQWRGVGMHLYAGSGFIGAIQEGNNRYYRKCSWTSFQYLCSGGINYCWTVLPGYVQLTCEVGYSASAGGYCIPDNEFIPERNFCSYNNGAALNPTVGNPVVLSTGAKIATDLDFATADGLLNISRHYRSLSSGQSIAFHNEVRGLASGWGFGFAYELQLREFSGTPSNPSALLAFVTPEGVAYDFELQSNGSWAPWSGNGASYLTTDVTLEFVGALPSNLSSLMNAPSSWRVTDGMGRTINFETQPWPNTNTHRVARPTSIETEAGYTWTFAYQTDYALTEITDSFGRQVSFTWHDRHLTSMTAAPGGLPYPEAIDEITFPDGTKARYIYDPTPNGVASAAPTPIIKRLIGVEILDDQGVVVDSTTYHYEDARFGWHLTGITDHSGQRIATYAYNSLGRVETTQGAAGSDLYTIEYSSDSSGMERRVTNPLGRVSVYRFDRFGSGAVDLRLTNVDGEVSANCPAASSSIAYDSNGFIASTVDEEGRTTSYVRDAEGHPTEIVEAAGTASSRTIDISWNLTADDPDSIVTDDLEQEFEYDNNGRLIKLTLTDLTNHMTPYATYGRVREWSYSYTPEGLLASIDGPLSGTADTISYTYDASGYLYSITNAVGHVTLVNSADDRGAPTSIVDQNGTIYNIAYDDLGRVVGITIDPGVSQSSYSMAYNASGDVSRLTLPGGSYLDYVYDADRRLSSVISSRGDVQRFTYNATDAITEYTVEGSSSSILFERTFAYDELSRLIEVVGADAQSTRIIYDKVDNINSVNDARSENWTSSFDELDRIVGYENPDLETLSFEYNESDQLTRLEDPRGLATVRKVDGFGQIIEEVSPDRGTLSYWYDEAGRLTQFQDGAGVVRTLTYDAAGRRLSMNFAAAPSENVTYTYDSTVSGNFGVGHLTRVDDQTGSTEFVYDAQGRVTQRIKTIASSVYNTGYDYDAYGRVTKLTMPSGLELFYDRDVDGLISGIRMSTSVGTPATIVDNIEWQAARGLSGLDFANGLSLERRYDVDGWLTDIILESGGVATIDLSFDRDEVGALSYQTDYRGGSARTAGYGYTDSGRLAWANGPWGERSYSYDENGNRSETRIVANGNGQEFEFAVINTTSNQVDEVRDTDWNLLRRFFYGNNGQLTREDRGSDTYRYFYNAAGRMVQVTLNGVVVGDYGYDAFGQRVWRDVNGGGTASIDYVFDGAGRLLALYNATTGAVAREFIWLEERLVAFVEHTGGIPVVHYVHTGQIDEILAITDASGSTLMEAYLTPYGLQEILSGSASLALRLPGQWNQYETGGLSQNWFRDYDPTLGRYVQTDPLGLVAGPNVYAYVDGNPLNAIDPMGLDVVVLQSTFMGRRGVGLRMDHTGLLVGRDVDGSGKGGWFYGSSNGGGPSDNEFIYYDTLSDALNSPEIGGRYGRAYRRGSSHIEDLMVQARMAQEVNEAYDFFSNNCGDMVRESLGAGGIEIGDTVNPAAAEDRYLRGPGWADISPMLPGLPQ